MYMYHIDLRKITYRFMFQYAQECKNKRAMMALDCSPESFFPQMNSTSLFLWFKLVIPGVGPVLIARGIIWIKLTKVYKEMLHTKNQSSIPSSYLPNCDPGGAVSFDPKGIIRIKLIKVHKEMLNTKYQSSNPSSFREKTIWSWFSLFLCSNLWPLGRGHKVHKEMLKTKYQSSTPSSFRGEKIWRWDSLFLCFNLWPPGCVKSWPNEHHMNKFGRGPLEDATYQIWKL